MILATHRIYYLNHHIIDYSYIIDFALVSKQIFEIASKYISANYLFRYAKN